MICGLFQSSEDPIRLLAQSLILVCIERIPGAALSLTVVPGHL